jgi:hypothetical protein
LSPAGDFLYFGGGIEAFAALFDGYFKRNRCSKDATENK